MSAEMAAVSWSRYRQPAPCFPISNRFQSTRIGGRASANEWDMRESVDRRSDRRSGYVPLPSFLLKHFCAVQVQNVPPCLSRRWAGGNGRHPDRESAYLNKAPGTLERAPPRAINAVRCTQPDRLSWRVSWISLCSRGSCTAQRFCRDGADRLSDLGAGANCGWCDPRRPSSFDNRSFGETGRGACGFVSPYIQTADS
jgi:hypothetical protein